MTRESRAPLIVAIVLLALPALYVGSYLALVVPGQTYNLTGVSGAVYRTYSYRYCGRWAECFFWPLEQIDRKLRPGAWQVADSTDGGIVPLPDFP